MSALTSIATIGIGATVGASCRYYIGIVSVQYLGKALPYGTLISNVLGSFIAGLLVVFILERLALFFVFSNSSFFHLFSDFFLLG